MPLGGALRETPLHIAARVQDGDKCAEMLLKSGASVALTMENGTHYADRVHA